MKTRKFMQSKGIKKFQSGFSLIELMVAITIGLFILGGLSVVFINLKQAFNAQASLSQLQDDERLGLTILKTAVEQAGYYPDPTTMVQTVVFPDSIGTLGVYNNFSAGQVISGGSGGSGGPGESISVRFVNVSGSGLVNCLGQTNNTGANQLVTESFIVNSSGELTCSVDAGSTWTALTGSITSMGISYGLDLSGNGSIDSYRTSDQTSAAASWKSVKSVKFSLSMVNPFSSLQGASGTTVKWNQVVNTMNFQ